MNKPKISVIVPIYNVELYLKRCLNSIINQTYKNLEIILVNDGSTDNSGSICDEYAKNDDRIIVIHKENAGLSHTRNVGMDNSTGDYISFIDSDDYIHLNTYELCLNVALKEDVDFVEFDVKKVNYQEQFPNFDNYNYEIHNSKQVIEYKVSIKKHYVYAWNKLFIRKFWLNYKFPDVSIGEDAFSFNEYAFNINKVAHIPLQLYHYYQRDGSLTKTIFTEKHLDSLKARIELYLLLKNTHLDLSEKQLFWVIRYFFVDFGIYNEQKKDKDKKLRLALIEIMLTVYDDIINSNLVSTIQRNDIILAKENPIKFIEKYEFGIVRKK